MEVVDCETLYTYIYITHEENKYEGLLECIDDYSIFNTEANMKVFLYNAMVEYVEKNNVIVQWKI